MHNYSYQITVAVHVTMHVIGLCNKFTDLQENVEALPGESVKDVTESPESSTLKDTVEGEQQKHKAPPTLYG